MENKTNFEVTEEGEQMVKFLNSLKHYVPGVDKLIGKISNERNWKNHLVHAEFVKRIFEMGGFKITKVENNFNENGKSYDVDIELNDSINIQVWNGASISNNKINNMKFGYDSKGFIFHYTGDDLKEDRRVFTKKLMKQLPDNNLGILINLENQSGTIDPEYLIDKSEMPYNKIFIKLYHRLLDSNINGPKFPEAEVFHSDKFKEMEIVKEIINQLSYTLKQEVDESIAKFNSILKGSENENN